ncbi:MAG: 16S rRNA (guanine(527)-N(7))-methyltransferase RsmG [Acidobacteriia bacterium]|nr:16S rRNA (guanine(527)-N(7))-methyltransferase RsmG [Terriglobia bacterium]
MFADLLRQHLAGIVDLSDEQVAALEAHYELLVRWNRSLNLTAITDLEEAIERHYCESLFVGQALNLPRQRIADIGSGPGFPGFPVAVLCPDCSITLIESHQRKAVFLKEASRSMPNVRVLAKRAENISESFDWAISRAVSYQDLSRSLRRLAPNAILLTGADPPPDDLGFSWRSPISLPWAPHRFLRMTL